MCGYHHLFVLWSDFRLCACNCCGCRKYDHSASYGAGLQKGFFNGNCCGCGRTRVIIPPSIPFIMYAMATGESVSDLFLAGIIPGLLIGALLMFYAYYHCKRYGEDKEKINAKVSELRSKGLFSILKDSIWAL